MSNIRPHKSDTSRSQSQPTFSFGSVTPYADKSEYVEKHLAFTLHQIDFQSGKGFDGEDRWAVSIEPADGRAPEILTFSSNEKRDDLLRAAQAHILKHGSIPNVTLVRAGNAYYLHNGPDKAA